MDIKMGVAATLPEFSEWTLTLAIWFQTYRSCVPLFHIDNLEIANYSSKNIVFNFLGDFGQAMWMRSCHEDMILIRRSHNCTGTACVQGDSASCSNLTEQTLISWIYTTARLLTLPYFQIMSIFRPRQCKSISFFEERIKNWLRL